MAKNIETDVKYNSNSRPRGRLKQLGASIPYTAYNRPLIKRLEIYENTFKYEPVIQQATDILIDALIGALGPVEHPDPEIQDFCRYSISRHEDTYCVDLFAKLREVIRITLWAGFSVTEPIYEIANSAILLKDYVTYHPSTIIIRTNRLGQLIENEVSYEGPHLKSGVYQTTTTKYHEVQLPLWKIALLTYNKEFNNYYGTSLIESCYRWHVLKEAYIDMMTTTIDRYGNPLTMITVPKISSGELRVNPITGEQSTLQMHELLQEQLANGYNASDSNFLLLPFMENNTRPQAQVLTGSNNLGTVFLEAIKYCEGQILRNLLIPFNLMDQSEATKDSFAERQIEIFNRVIVSLYRTIVVPFVNQTLYRQVKYNFTRESANTPPKLPLRKTTRPEARVALMQMIKGLTETGYLNPTSEADWSSIREMVDALHRPMDSGDLKFVKDVLVEPRKKPKPAAPGANPKAPGGSGTKSTPQGAGKEGRPTGSVTPQQESRPRKKDSD